MSTDKKKLDRPLWVKIGLWGVNRKAAWEYFWLTLIMAVGFVGLGVVHPLFFLGSFMILASAWYYLSIRWMDKHGGWPDTPK